MQTLSPDQPRTSDRFQKTRARILDAAARLINEYGLRGLTFVAVGEAVGMNTTSITYYFRKKEQLAVAALEQAIDTLDRMILTAAEEPTPEARVSRLIRLRLDHSAAVRLGTEPMIALLGDLRATEEPERERLRKRYQVLIWRTGRFFGPMDDALTANRRIAAGQVLLDVIHWMRAWLPQYDLGDFDRIHERLMDLLRHGFAAPGARWQAAPVAPWGPLELPPLEQEDSQTAYLRAATVLINDRGYRGASVDEIAGLLKLSKGSFYHHMDSKDELVLNCFRSSYTRLLQHQRDALARPGSHWTRITACLAGLLTIQFDGQFPFLRTTATQALPAALREGVFRQSAHVGHRFAGMLSDGIAEGSVRAVDPLITSQCLLALINSSYDLQQWARRMPSADLAVEVYAATLAFGLFDERGCQAADG